MNDLGFNQSFHEAKANLNSAQREAVETVEGPVMVLAGPGTGKTQVLAFRIAEILQRTDSSPRNILALTFTESGVVAMRERLASLIGATAYGVGIYTFHGFANRVINESGAEFYKTHNLEQIDDIAQLQSIMRLLDDSSEPLLRPPRAPYFYVKPILRAIKSLKSEGITPNQLRDLAQSTIDELAQDPASLSKSGKTKGELKQSVKTQIEQYQRTQAMAAIFEKYEQFLAEQGLYDYEDMILFVLRSFETNPDLKARYQEQFHYILVDEYQDTNNAQNKLVRLLADYFANPNVFVVGDDKQSIYRFQGASMANLLNFREWYPDAKVISLQENYRSGQPILDNADALIQHNHEQLHTAIPEIQTTLHAQNTDGVIDFLSYPTADTEALGVVHQIKSLVEQGVPAAHIAILYRENREAEQFADLLARQNIPYLLESGTNVLNDPDVSHLINLLTLAANPHDNMALFRYFHADYSGISTPDLLTVGQWLKKQRQDWASLLESATMPADLSHTDGATFQALWHKIGAWYRYQTQHTVGEVVEHILFDSGLLNAIMAMPDRLERLHRVRCFFDDVKTLLASKPQASLRDLFERLAIRQTYNVPLIAGPLIETGDNAVRLMTAHKSKGLEFEYVFIPHFLDGLWSNGRSKQELRLPPAIVPHHEVSEEQSLEEDRRLFYVALTRAKKKVVISAAEFNSENKKQMPAQFLSELNNIELVKPESVNKLHIEAFFSPITNHFVDRKSRAQLEELVTQQSLTPTSINTYLTCPMEYLYKHVYQIPGVREPDQAYGTAVHKALELWGNWSRGGDSVTLAKILEVFDDALTNEGLSEKDKIRFQSLGHDVLTAYYQQFHAEWLAPLATEYSFSPHDVLLDGQIPITGKIDKIEPIPGSKHVRLIDFKTGRVRSRNEIEGNTASSDGDYKRQLVFYAVLAECDAAFPYTVGEATLAFIDDQKKFTVESFIITKEEKEDLKQLIRSVYKEITALHFDHTPHKVQFAKGESLCDLLRRDLQGSKFIQEPSHAVSIE